MLSRTLLVLLLLVPVTQVAAQPNPAQPQPQPQPPQPQLQPQPQPQPPPQPQLQPQPQPQPIPAQPLPGGPGAAQPPVQQPPPPAAQIQPPPAQPEAPADPRTPPPAPPVLVVPIPDARFTPPVASLIRDTVVAQLTPMVLRRQVVSLTDETRLAAVAACRDPACIGAQVAEGGGIAGVLVHMRRPRGPRGPIEVRLEVVDPVSGAPRQEPVLVSIPAANEADPAALLQPATAQLQPSMPAPPPISSLLITVNIDGARVRINDFEIGASPLAPVDLPPGRYTLFATAEGHLSTRRQVEISAGENARVDLDLPPDPSFVAAGGGAGGRGGLGGGGGGGPGEEGPWFTRWYVIAGGAAAVVAITVVIVLIASSGSDPQGPTGIPIPPIRGM